MNLWIIAAIIVGLLVIVGVAVANLSFAKTADKAGCQSCGGSCTAEKNCGQATCGAVNGDKCSCLK